MEGVVRDGLQRLTNTGFLLLGHPRTVSRALALDDLLRELDAPLDGVVYLRLPETEVERRIHRLAARRRCRNDQTHHFVPEMDRLRVDGVCHCGGELYQREDETETMFRNMFMSYAATLEPLTQHYAEQGLLVIGEDRNQRLRLWSAASARLDISPKVPTASTVITRLSKGKLSSIRRP